MIWLAWRQFRTQAFVVAAVLAVLGIALGLDGSHLVHLYDTTVAMCRLHGDCSPVTQNFESQAKWNHALDALVLVAPALFGAFWGAPLIARELETRTNRLAWTQSVSRSRWFLVKVAALGVASLITAGLLSFMVTWWAAPYDRLMGSPYTVFDQRDVVPIAYALFAFALGVSAGDPHPPDTSGHGHYGRGVCRHPRRVRLVDPTSAIRPTAHHGGVCPSDATQHRHHPWPASAPETGSSLKRS